jgi:hypothetical protein
MVDGGVALALTGRLLQMSEAFFRADGITLI